MQFILAKNKPYSSYPLSNPMQLPVMTILKQMVNDDPESLFSKSLQAKSAEFALPFSPALKAQTLLPTR